MTRRILVVGGTGAFGARLVEGLVATTDLAVVVGARNVDRAHALAADLRQRYPDRAVEAVAVDVATLNAQRLRDLAVWCVFDAAGPFQNAEPRVATAAIEARCHCVDLADARDFVARFPQLDEAAKAAGIVAVSGASSTPALSNAAADELTRGWRRVDSIEVAIAPGNRAPRGESVVRAILSQVGQPVRLFRGGAWGSARGWTLLTRRRMPGLGRRWLALVETPDLDLLPRRFAPRDAAIFRAGLELPVMHLGLWCLGGLVTLGAMRSLSPLARPLLWIADRLRPWGTDRGGMTVQADGLDADGRPVRAVWALVAAAGDGPNVPTLPAVAFVRALAGGREVAAGAYACTGLLSLADITAEFARFRIVTRRTCMPRPVLWRALGEEFERLPEPIRRGHLVDGTLVLAGRAAIEGAETMAGRIIARLIGFPGPSADTPVRVEMTARDDSEVWRRTFGRHAFSSHLRAAAGRRGLATERFGLLTFALALRADAEGLWLEATSARLGPVPLPQFLVPLSNARERLDAEGRFSFDVPISLPGIGRIVRYRGWLVPADES